MQGLPSGHRAGREVKGERVRCLWDTGSSVRSAQGVVGVLPPALPGSSSPPLSGLVRPVLLSSAAEVPCPVEATWCVGWCAFLF